MRIVLLILLLSLPGWCKGGERSEKLLRQVEQIIQKASVGSTAVAITHLSSQERVLIKADQPFPLASVFKVPVMVELARQMQTQRLKLTLDSPIAIRNSDKCIGSGSLQHQPGGTQVSVRRLVELMETRSDNTATDVIFRRIGLDSVDQMMGELGCTSSQIFLTNRAAWLISLAQSSDFRGLTPHQIAGKWKTFNRQQRLQAARKAEDENSSLSLQKFQALDDRSADHNTSAENVVVATTVDNLASAQDLSILLAKLYQGELLNKTWTEYCLGVLGRQAFNTRIPRLLPKSVRVLHKTGTIAGVVNDIGIVEIAPNNTLVVVVLVQQVGENQEGRAEKLIAEIARAAYATYR